MATKGAKLLRPSDQHDRYYRYGLLLLEASECGDPLERLLAVVRLLVIYAADVSRGSQDPRDLPLTLLGAHLVTYRKLGQGGAQSRHKVHVQEVCSHDSKEGPKLLKKVQAPAVGQFNLRCDPQAKAKAKKMGKELYVKVSLGAIGSLQLPLPGHDSCEESEGYEFTLPSVVLVGGAAMAAGEMVTAMELRGEMSVQCMSTGMMATLSFKPGPEALVEGSVEQQMKPGGSSKTSERLRSMMARSGPQRLGSFSGSWRGAISVQCPDLGLQGIVVDQQPSQAAYSSSDNLLEEINLKTPPPVQLPRLWAVLHACLLYNDPARASGGKAAQDLSSSLAYYLSALCLDVPNVPTNPGAQKGADSADEEEEDDDDMGSSKGLSLSFKRKGKQAARAPKDARSVPPCVKAEHAAGKKLHYELQLVLTRA